MPDDIKIEGITKEDVFAQVERPGNWLEGISGVSGSHYSSVIHNTSSCSLIPSSAYVLHDAGIQFNADLHNQPVAITLRGALDIGNFRPNNNLEIFVDDSGHLCVKGPDGVVSYVVLSTVPPETGAQIIPPSYEAKSKEPVPVVILNKLSAPITLWDHLQDEEF
jgi:hypothetical protein